MENACLVRKDVWDALWMIQEPVPRVRQDITCLSGIATKPALRRPSVRNGNAKPVALTVAAATNMSATGVRRASFSQVAAVCKIVTLASMETKSWENASPATEPVRLAPAWATTSAAAVQKGYSCGMGRVSGPPGPMWKARSGMMQRGSINPVILPVKPATDLSARRVLQVHTCGCRPVFPPVPKALGCQSGVAAVKSVRRAVLPAPEMTFANGA